VKLKSLRLFGFKTFAEQTALAFEPGITALVGPNGSGKSNLVDAIRWVLGEQSAKSLRSTKTEDVIFAGNDRRKPLGMAEVSLTFDNSDGALKIDATEVQITRRAYRAGESEFYINRQSVRLRDVIELLMGTGLGPGSYAIVSQGQIDAILAAKPSERRSLFEETAGINKFLARKNESLRRLEQTEQNGIRVNDLVSEIAGRIPELETQARRAKRFRKTSARLRDLEILSYLRASASRRSERETLQAQLERLEFERASAAARAATLDAELAALRTGLLDRERALEALRGEATAARAELAELDAQRAAMTARLGALQGQSSQITGDRERAEAEQVELRAAVAELEAEIVPRSAELDGHRERERAAQEALSSARAALDQIFTALRAVEAAAAADAASEAQRRAQLAAAQSDFERVEREAFALREEAEHKSELLAAGAHELETARAELAELDDRSAAAAAAVARADERLGLATQGLIDAQAAYRSATSELASAEARLHTIEELEANLEGHIPGTRAVLEANARGEFSGIVGVVSNLIRVDEQYARALDVAFGASLSNIVTERAEDAERAIAFLRSHEAGRATFLPLDTLGTRNGRTSSDTPRVPGVIGYAHELARPTEPRWEGIVAFLVGRILVVETLDVGIKLVRGSGFRDAIVTLEGDEIRGGGAMTGGRYKRERSILSRRAQARTLSEALPALRARLEAAQSAATAASEESLVATRERDEARRAGGDLAVRLRDAYARVETLNTARTRLEAEIAAMLERAAERDAETSVLREKLAALDRPAADPATLHADRERLETSLAEARETIARAQDAERAVAASIASSREAVAALVARRDGALARLGLLDADRERAALARESMSAELESLAERIADTEGALERAKERVAAVDERNEAARRDREATAGQAQQMEADLRLAQAAEREAGTASEGGRLRLAEIDGELGMLAAQFAQNPATAEECADVEERYAKEEGEFAAEVVRLREDLARLQNVNLNAEAEIEELAERERFLREQLDDLARARETLLASIKEIEESSQIAFNETFALVKAAFEKVYARLFVGGVAQMWQTSPDNLSETGIEISVQPPGKKMMSLTALSGGERAMAASALIFALIAVKPSPFYLLDEVDAALDDANVERFSGLVREVGSSAQLLIVTHNKKTMELAQRMYGVTMAEPGISSVISADLTPGDAEPELVADAADVVEPPALDDHVAGTERGGAAASDEAALGNDVSGGHRVEVSEGAALVG
jgi:chromosome segregation protein